MLLPSLLRLQSRVQHVGAYLINVFLPLDRNNGRDVRRLFHLVGHVDIRLRLLLHLTSLRQNRRLRLLLNGRITEARKGTFVRDGTGRPFVDSLDLSGVRVVRLEGLDDPVRPLVIRQYNTRIRRDRLAYLRRKRPLSHGYEVSYRRRVLRDKRNNGCHGTYINGLHVFSPCVSRFLNAYRQLGLFIHREMVLSVGSRRDEVDTGLLRRLRE